MIRITQSIIINEDEIDEHFVRAPVPGGHERDPEVRDKLSRGLDKRTTLVAERSAGEQKDGQLRKQPDAETFAQMIISVTHSLALRARIRAS